MMALGLVACLTLVAGDVDDLERRLKDGEERNRRTAVQELAKLDTDEAWELVLDALRDPEPMVADEAQLVLGDSANADVRDALLGKAGIGARDALVRLRAAEALGRIELELDPSSVLKKLKDKDPEVRRTLLWTIERQALAGRLVRGKRDQALLDALEKLQARDKDPGVRAAAWMALHAFDPEGDAERFERLERDQPVELRCATVRSQLDEEPELKTIVSWTRSPEQAVRSLAITALAEGGTTEHVAALIEHLPKERNRRLAWAIVGHLQELSGKKHGLDPRPWQAWSEGLSAGWTPGKPRRDAREVGNRSVAFAGMPVLSEYLVILVDFSGSLWEERDGKTRKEAVDVELRRLLEALPETTYFNLVPYTNEPIPWKDVLTPATKKNVADALDFFEGCKASGKGNAWDALSLAFDHKGVDTVVILTDGAPSGGTRWNLGLMADLVAEKNRFRGVALDALLVDAGGLKRYWERICRDSGGRVLAVDL